MRKTLVLALGLSALALAACNQVEPGSVGIRVHQYGSDAGKMDILQVGTYMPQWGTTTYEFPVSTKNYTFTRSQTEGQGVNEEFSFQDISGLAMTADLGVNYSVNPEKAPVLFSKYRALIASSKEPLDAIVDGPLRNEIRDSLIRHASALPVDELYGPKKAAVLSAVEADVRGFFAPLGLQVEHLFWVNPIRPPDTVIAQINARVANEQQARAEVSKVDTIKARAQQAEAEATGKAQALDVEGEAIRRNPEVLRIRAIEKWNGVLPQVTSGATPFIELGK